MAAKSKKSRPSAFRDFPVGCGRNAPAMTREDLAVKHSSSEVHRVPVKGDADARNAGLGEGLKAGELEDKQALTMLENGEKLDESGDVMPSQSEAKQPASETKTEKKKDGEGDQMPANPEAKQLTPKAKTGRKVNDEEGVVPSKAEAKQSAPKAKIDRKIDEEEGAVPAKSEAKQLAPKAKIDRKIDGNEGVIPAKPEAKQLTPKVKIDRRVNDEDGGEPPKPEAKQSAAKAKIDRKGDSEKGVMASKPEAKQPTPKKMGTDKANGEEDGISAKSEAKQAASKIKIDKKGDGKGDASVTPSNLETKKAVQNKKSINEGEGGSRPSESKQEKKKITRKTDAEEPVAPSKATYKQAAPKVESSNQDTATKMPVLDSEEPVPMDPETTPVKMKNHREDQEGPEIDLIPVGVTEDGGKPSKPEAKHSATKVKIDRKGDSEKGAMASKPEAKQPTPKKMRTDKGNDEEDGISARSEAKQAASKINIDKKGDGKGDASVTPSNRETKKAVQKKKSVMEGEGEGGSRPSESKQVKKKITKKNDAEERVAPSKAKYKQAAPKVESSNQGTASEEPVPMDSETTPVKMENHLGGQEEPETDSTPVEVTEAGSKKRKKAPPSKKKHSGKKTKVFRASDGDNDGSAVSDRKEVKNVLMTFDALRRNFMVEEDGGGVKRPDLKSGTLMLEKGLWLNRDRKIVGSVPGVLSGDHFFFRLEMCILGLHGQVQAGIDYIGANNSEWSDPVAVSIIASGGYEDDEDDGGETLVYTGQGGNNYKMDKKQNDDQKLERGNLALERSKHHGVEVRVIRGIKDNASPSGKIYVYDGLYKVEDSWLDKGKSGFGVFKYRLKRLPGQPELPSDILKSAVKWKRKPSLRQGLINPDISSKRENLAVYLVNNVDDDKGPEDFEYISKVRYSNSVPKLEPSQGCDCKSSCSSSDKCLCFQLNGGGEMPYTQNGFIVKWRPLIYECGEHCRCPQTCRNRVSQKGPKFHLEVFRKDNGGWGVRSWDPIPAGTFICEYVGEILLDEEIDQQFEENQYVLNANRSQENLTDWGNVSDMLPEKKQDGASPTRLELKFTINAREMGNVARFINHSCSPNVFLQSVVYDHQDTRFPHIMLFSIEHIPPLTELTLDYGVTDMQTT